MGLDCTTAYPKIKFSIYIPTSHSPKITSYKQHSTPYTPQKKHFPPFPIHRPSISYPINASPIELLSYHPIPPLFYLRALNTPSTTLSPESEMSSSSVLLTGQLNHEIGYKFLRYLRKASFATPSPTSKALLKQLGGLGAKRKSCAPSKVFTDITQRDTQNSLPTYLTPLNHTAMISPRIPNLALHFHFLLLPLLLLHIEPATPSLHSLRPFTFSSVHHFAFALHSLIINRKPRSKVIDIVRPLRTVASSSPPSQNPYPYISPLSHPLFPGISPYPLH